MPSDDHTIKLFACSFVGQFHWLHTTRPGSVPTCLKRSVPPVVYVELGKLGLDLTHLYVTIGTPKPELGKKLGIPVLLHMNQFV